MRRTLVATTALAVAVFLGLALLLRPLPHAMATGDAAVTEIFVLHASRGLWSLGPYSQFYWNHPGPLMFYLLAPLYALSGQHAQALNVGAAALNVLAIAILVRIVARAAEPIATVSVSAAVAVWLVRASDTLSSFWNPVLIALPAVLFVWLCAAVAGGRGGLIALLLGVGSFLAQSHVGLVPAVGVLSAVALAAGWSRTRQDGATDARGRWRRGLATGGIVAGLLWALPTVEQFTENPGNLTIVARFFASAPPGPRTIAQSATMWATAQAQLLMPGFREPTGVPLAVDAEPVLVAVGLGTVALLGAMSWLTRARPGLSRPAGFHALIGLVALAEIHRSPGLVGDYTIFWLAPIGASGIMLLAGWALGCLGSVAPAAPALAIVRLVAWMPAAVAVLAACCAGLDLRRHVPGVFSASAPISAPALSEEATLSLQTRDSLRARGIVDPVVHIADDVWAEAAATLLQMYKAREPFTVDPAWRFMYGRPLTHARCHTHRLRFAMRDVDGGGEVIAQAGRVSVRVEPHGTCPGR